MITESYDITDLFAEECNPARISLTDLADSIFFTHDQEWRQTHIRTVREIFLDKIRRLEIDYQKERVYALVETPKGYAIADVCSLPMTHVCFSQQPPVVFPKSGKYN